MHAYDFASRRNFLKKAGLGTLGLAFGMAGWNPGNAATAPSAAFPKLGASTACLAGFSLLEAFGQLQRQGFSTVEVIAYPDARHSVGPIPGFALHRATAKERQAVWEATRPFTHISAHLPFHDLHPFSTDADVRDFSIGQLRKGIDTLAFLKGELAVIHPGWPGPGQTYKDIWPQMRDTFRRLGDYAGSKGIRIGLETMQPASVQEFSQLIFDINHPQVGATIDTGHIRGSSDIGLANEQKYTSEGSTRFNQVLFQLIETLGEKVYHYHLTDVRQSNWRDHHTLGTGIIDFPRLFQKLNHQQYKGLLVFELEEPAQLEALQASKQYSEKFLKS